MTTTTKVRKPGLRMTTTGIVILVLGAVLLVMNLMSTFAKYVPGVGTVEMQGTPSAGSIIMIIAGLILAGIGFARRVLSAMESR